MRLIEAKISRVQSFHATPTGIVGADYLGGLVDASAIAPPYGIYSIKIDEMP